VTGAGRKSFTAPTVPSTAGKRLAAPGTVTGVVQATQQRLTSAGVASNLFETGSSNIKKTNNRGVHMLLSIHNTEHITKYTIHDACGQKLGYIQTFDTETCVATILLPIVKNQGMALRQTSLGDTPIVATVELPGAYACDEYGKIIQDNDK
jgi:hypothetical protein